MSKDKDAFKEAKKAAKKDHDTHVIVLMDETGSMGGLEEAVTTGVNTFLAEFRKSKATVRATLAWFDKHPESPRTRFKVKAQKIGKVVDLTPADYNPRGLTPLYDAVVDTLAFITEKRRDDEVVFLAIITDGGENASETKQHTVQAAIAKAEKAGWGIVFLGANIDAEAAAADLGLRAKGQAFNYTASGQGMASNMRSAASLGRARSNAGVGYVGELAYAAQAAALYDQTSGVIAEDKAIEVDEDGNLKPTTSASSSTGA